MTQSATTSQAILQYASPRSGAPENPGFHRAIILCWGVPFVAGVLILLGWIITSSPLFALLGLCCILIGTATFCVGGVLLLTMLIQDLRAGRPVGPTLLRFFLLAALLLSNFLTAWLCIFVADAVHPMSFG